MNWGRGHADALAALFYSFPRFATRGWVGPSSLAGRIVILGKQFTADQSNVAKAIVALGNHISLVGDIKKRERIPWT
jgi:hypothetical protein